MAQEVQIKCINKSDRPNARDGDRDRAPYFWRFHVRGRSNRAVHEWLAPVFHRPPVRRPPHHDNRMFKVLLKAWKTEKYR
jgi:hypothetical protein